MPRSGHDSIAISWGLVSRIFLNLTIPPRDLFDQEDIAEVLSGSAPRVFGRLPDFDPLLRIEGKVGADLFVERAVGRRSTNDVPDEPAPTLREGQVFLRLVS